MDESRMSAALLPGQPGAPTARDRVVDVLMVLIAVGLGVVGFVDVGGRADGLVALDALLGLIALGLLTRRRRSPDAVGIVTGLFSVVSPLAAGVGLIAGFNVALRGSRRGILAVVAIAVPATFLYPVIYPSSGDDDYLLSITVGVLGTAVAFGWGLLARVRREQLAALRDNAARLVEEAREAERKRIAREMHDVLAHRLSLLSLHAGALEYRGDEAARVIRETAREALEDLRDVIGILRDGEAGPVPEPPQPTLADVPALVDESRAAGVDVELRLDAPDAERALGRTVYRIVQEGLTNARKHAPGAKVLVDVARSDGQLTTTVHTRRPVGVAAAVPGAGAGLTGLAERVSLAGGTLEHGPDSDGDFLLRARLPWSGS